MHKDANAEDQRQSEVADSTGEGQVTSVKNGRLAVASEVTAGTRDKSSAMMAILPVKVWNTDCSRSVVTYAFLDMGSSATFCTPGLLQSLGMDGETTRLTMTTATTENQGVTCKLAKGLKISDIQAQQIVNMPPSYTLDKIPVDCKDIATIEDLKDWPHLQNLVPQRVEADIGVLIGANCPEILTPLEVRATQGGCPFAMRTVLGWVVYGPRTNRQFPSQPAKLNRIRVETSNNDSDLHAKFVALYNQDFGYDNSADGLEMSVEDHIWMKKVEEGICHTNGHYEIPMPTKNEAPLPENKQQAEKRAEQLKRKMARDEKYFEDYKKFVNDLIERDYAEKVSGGKLGAYLGRTWYIPHHGVYHPRKPTKIRVVYDCSATYQGVSLNDRLLQGPNLTSSLVGVLLRFRQKPFAVMADIEKMFYQVRVPAEDRSLLRFLWWPNGDTEKDLEEYQMNVHLFGAVSSPACANFALRRTVQDFGHIFDDDVRDSIQRSFYVDDFMRAGSTPEEVLKIARGVRDCCALGGFRLTSFVSNSADVMLGLPEAERVAQRKFDLTGHESAQTQRALGVQWDISEDTLSFRVDIAKGAATRRGLLSMVSAVYDPLGFGAPFVMPAKILLQDLCRLRLGWDDPIPEDHLKRWNRWCEELTGLQKFRVPRSVTPPSLEIQNRQLHIFADASEVGYGAVAYVRVQDATGEISTSLLMSKSRVAPLKVCSIPRLELTSATLAVQISTQILAELDIPFDEVHFWTDSVSTLRYIQNTTSRFKTFVANRLAIIHDGSSTNQWHYVPSALNPADGLSRGQMGQEFLSSCWTTGPLFLRKEASEWPEQKHVTQSEFDLEELEVKRSLVNTAVVAERDYIAQLLSSTSDWFTLKKRVAWMLRLKRILQQRVACRKRGAVREAGSTWSSRLTVQELVESETAIVRSVQEASFPDELKDRPVRKSSPLYRLHPCMIDGTLRVGGRLTNAAISDRAKHQIVLPKKGHVTDLIIRDMHERRGHTGREHVLAELRAKYWIVDGNAAVRRVLSKCVKCRKIQGPVVTQIMSDLPEDRTTSDGGIFSRVGTDYFGPFYVKSGRKQLKRFCVLFTCLSTHAIHIEVCESLDTSSFINALRRFQARRGQVKFIRSDNGTNFVGAERELREEARKLREKSVHEFLLKEGITWKFNPPGASSQGGVWERQIRSIRKVLNALLQEQSVTEESLRTLMCEIEAVLNSKPLTTVSSDPSDLQPLTPNDLLLLRGGPVPDGIFSERDSCISRRWRQVQYLADVFWKRWLKEYLPSLQKRQKWVKQERNLSVDDVVLITDMNVPRCRWPLGRVVEVFPDNKGFVRSVLVKTASSVFRRPISKLVLVLESE